MWVLDAWRGHCWRVARAGVAALLLLLPAAGACGAVPENLWRQTRQAEQAHGLPEDLLVSLVWAESRYCVRAVSEAGAQGLGQLMPATARSLGVRDPFDPRQNLQGAGRYLRMLWFQFRSWDVALQAYHDGPGNVQAGRWSARGRAHVQVILQTYWALRRQGGLQYPRPEPVPARQRGAG